MDKEEGWVEVEEGCEYPNYGQVVFTNIMIGDEFALTAYCEYLGPREWRLLSSIPPLTAGRQVVTHWAKFDLGAHMAKLGLVNK